MSGGRTVRIDAELDVATAAREARGLAEACGLSGVEAQHVATAVSEVACNAVKYAAGGEVELAPAERAGRRGLRVTVRDRGPGIADVAAALRDGVSSGGSLGLGLPGARRLMDDFTIRSGPAGTVIAMARWEGGLLASGSPALCAVVEGHGGVALAQPFRNGLLLGIAAGSRAADVARAWRTRPWHAPAQLAEAARERLHPGERLGLAVASVSGLDGRLAWLQAGAVGCVLLRGGDVAVPPVGPALGGGGDAFLRAATIDVRRDDLLVMAATPMAPAALAELARGRGDGPAHLTARFERGTLEPRRPHDADRRGRRPGSGVVDGSTLEGP